MSELSQIGEIPHARSEALPGYSIKPGDVVRIRDAAGEWHTAKAATGVVRGHKFPIVWVDAVGRNGQPCRLPWPVDAVEPSVVSQLEEQP